MLQHDGGLSVGVVLDVTDEEAHDERVDHGEDEQHYGRALQGRRGENDHLVDHAPHSLLRVLLRDYDKDKKDTSRTSA